MSKRFDRRAITPAIASVILAAATIVMGFAILAWSQSRTTSYQDEYGNVMGAETSRLGERLTLEYSFYNHTQKSIRLYFLNYGTADDVKIQSAQIQNDTWQTTLTNLTLRFFNGTTMFDQDLDVNEEGYVDLSFSPESLMIGEYYRVTISTVRASSFSWSVVT